MLIGIVKLQWVFVAHHLIGIALIILIEHSGMLHRYIPIICLFEVSSVPLNIRYALLHVGKDKLSRQVIYTEVAFFISFLMVRWVFGFRKAYHLIMTLHEIEEKNHLESVVAFTVTVVVLMFLLMHVHWTVGIFKRVVKYIKKWKTFRSQKIPTDGVKYKTP